MATIRTKMEQLCAFDYLMLSHASHDNDGGARMDLMESINEHYTQPGEFDLKTATEELEAILKAGHAVLRTLEKATLESQDDTKIDLEADIIYESDEDGDGCKKRKVQP